MLIWLTMLIYILNRQHRLHINNKNITSKNINSLNQQLILNRRFSQFLSQPLKKIRWRSLLNLKKWSKQD